MIHAWRRCDGPREGLGSQFGRLGRQIRLRLSRLAHIFRDLERTPWLIQAPFWDPLCLVTHRENASRGAFCFWITPSGEDAFLSPNKNFLWLMHVHDFCFYTVFFSPLLAR